MKTIFVTFPFGITARNIICSRLIEHLRAKDFKVVVITPKKSHEFLSGIFKDENIIFEDFPLYEEMRKNIFDTMSFAERVLIGFINSPLDTGATRCQRMALLHNQKKYIRFVARWTFQTIFQNKYRFSDFCRMLDAKFFPDTSFNELFDKYSPSAVFSPHVQFDVHLLKQARQRKILSFGMPISTDTMTTKGMIRVKSDYLLVWNEIMKGEAVKFNTYKPENVFLVGIPQYDFSFEKRGLMSREEFFAKAKLDPNKEFILYASEATDSEDDAEMVKYLVEGLRSGIIKENVSILVRPHPRDWRKDTFELLKGIDEVVVDDPRSNTDIFLDRWYPSMENIVWLVNSIYHSKLVIMMGSTMGLDATCFGKPVISLGFDTRPKTYYKSVRKYYDMFPHQQYWFSTGAYRIAESKESLILEINRYLEHPEFETAERKILIDKLFYKFDGKVGERIADVIAEKTL